MAILVQSNKKPSVSFPEQTGSIVTFNSQYAGLPLKSCKVNIPITQEGTGDPSPDNVRNFVGVSSLDFTANSVVKTFQFGQTIYAGELDVLTGTFTATHVFYKPTSPRSISSNKAAIFGLPATASGFTLETNSFYCNCLRPSNYSDDFDNHIHFINKALLAMRFEDDIEVKKTDWESYLSIHPVEVVYQLEIPEVINLGGMEIATLQGENNLFASTGETTAQYIKIGG